MTRPNPLKYEWRVQYRRRGWVRHSLQARLYQSVPPVQRLVDRLLRGRSRPDLEEVIEVRIDRRVVGEWEPVETRGPGGVVVTAKRRSKGAPIALRWQGLLRADRDIPHENPGRVAVIAVGAVLVGYADSDGGNCRPAIDTIVREAGVSRRTALAVLGWLVVNGWLAVTARVQRRPTVYRLTIPVGAEEHLPDDLSKVLRSTYEESPVGAVVGAVVGAPEHHYLRPPSKSEEEEESASAPSADAPVAALQSTEPLDLFADDPAPLAEGVREIAESIASRDGRGINARVIEPGVVGVRVRLAWGDEAISVYCVEKLKVCKTSPSGFLAKDLANLNGDTVPSPRVKLALGLQALDEVDKLVGSTFPDLAIAEEADPYVFLERGLDASGLAHVTQMLVDGAPVVWELKAGDLEQVLEVTGFALNHARRAVEAASAPHETDDH